MRLLNERFNEEINFTSFIDEFDRFDEIDIDMISKEYEIKFESKIGCFSLSLSVFTLSLIVAIRLELLLL